MRLSPDWFFGLGRLTTGGAVRHVSLFTVLESSLLVFVSSLRAWQVLLLEGELPRCAGHHSLSSSSCLRPVLVFFVCRPKLFTFLKYLAPLPLEPRIELMTENTQIRRQRFYQLHHRGIGLGGWAYSLP